MSAAGSVCVFAPVTLLTITVEATPDGEAELHVHAGGQGVWIARMILALGADVVLVTPLGGETGRVAGHLLADEGIPLRTVGTAQATAAWIQDRRDGERSTYWESSPRALGRHELDELYSLALAECLRTGTAVIAGTHEADEVLPDETFVRLAADLAANDVHVVADVTGAQLDAVVERGAPLVKVSADDLVRDGHAASDEQSELVAAASALAAGGATVVVSRSSAGAIALRDGELHLAAAPELEAVDTRGAGDSMTAALAVAVSRGLGWDDSLRLAAAAGAVNVTRHGSGSGRRETIEAIARRVDVTLLR
ncbi:MAG: PfkB family carbohydrate kinase [Thermoleophilia bacterium]